MNLSKRALLVIIPVVSLSYAVAAISVYFAMEESIRRLEQNRIELIAAELSASFTQYSAFAESYLPSLIESRTFEALINTEDDLFLQVALGSSIETAIKNLNQHKSEVFSFFVVDGNNSPMRDIYFFELSNDPFSEPSERQRALVRQLFSERITSSIDYLANGDRGLIVASRMLNRISLQAPVASQINDALVVQLAIEPSEYYALQEKLLRNDDARVTITDQPENWPDRLVARHQLSPELTLQIALPKTYLSNKLLLTKLTLTVVAIVFFFLSALLLYRLIRKYITQPVQNLERELSAVMTNKKDNISVSSNRNDEISRLEKTFQKLYGDLSDSYLRTKELAEHDPLTNLHNLAYINQRAQEALVQARKRGDHVALIYIDLDNFKFVNDKHGHEVGDALLKAFATKLTQVVRHADIIRGEATMESDHGRIAGDEFSIILTNYGTDPSVPEKVANRIIKIFENGFSFELGTFPVSASIGIAVYPKDGSTLSQLVSNADHAMYQAKSSGKNQIAYYSKSLAVTLRRRAAIEQELKTCNFDDEFYLVYMPLIGSKTRNIDGFEVLVRWESEKLGFVGPDEFIPIAESSGLFTRVDAWVCAQAISAYKPLKDRLGRDFKLSINLSSAQLNMNSIDQLLLELTKKHGVKTQCIQLEMTETLNVEFTSQAGALLKRLSDAGFQIAIDDFGTGYTALLQLVEYPAEMIKFDKTFTDKALEPENRSMLEPLISLCHSQDLLVTVEGVETESVAKYLEEIGCDYLQGYHFGKPCRIEELDLDQLNGLPSQSA